MIFCSLFSLNIFNVLIVWRMNVRVCVCVSVFVQRMTKCILESNEKKIDECSPITDQCDEQEHEKERVQKNCHAVIMSSTSSACWSVDNKQCFGLLPFTRFVYQKFSRWVYLFYHAVVLELIMLCVLYSYSCLYQGILAM